MHHTTFFNHTRMNLYIYQSTIGHQSIFIIQFVYRSFITLSSSRHLSYTVSMNVITFLIYEYNSIQHLCVYRIYRALIIFEYINKYYLVIRSLFITFSYRSFLIIVHSLIFPHSHSSFIINTSGIIHHSYLSTMYPSSFINN